MLTIEKVYDELISMISDLQKNSGSASAGKIVVVTQYTEPAEDDVFYAVYSDNKIQTVYFSHDHHVTVIYGSIPTSLEILLDEDAHASYIKAPFVLSDDGSTHFDDTNYCIVFKSSAGEYVSFARCLETINIADFNKYNVTCTYGGEEHDFFVTDAEILAEVTVRNFQLGMYFQATLSGYAIGLCVWDEMRPDIIHLIEKATGTGDPGTISLKYLDAQKSTT